MSNDSCSYIHQISTEKDTWKLKVRVLRLWKQSYQIDMILMDEKGDKIQATIKKVLMCVFENQLEEGSVVFLSKFGVGEMNGKFPVIKYSYKLIFYRHTNVKHCENFDGPLYGFQFVDLHHIINREVEVESTVG
ncbi:uncharacterized protein LOC118487346 [Helianthus annuus]|uniref:uncharacterized protein LOC118487346 n=1 Tax=Helianthus annuus TaxID=4232 RepID=UPI001652F2E0|nr:uncharacterized protein LOC118487346 [Helianthus annuus]